MPAALASIALIKAVMPNSRRFVTLRSLNLLACALCAFLYPTVVDARREGSAATASRLQSSAVLLATSSYSITNVATGQKLIYVPNGNHIYPTSGSGSPIGIEPHPAAHPWLKIHFGSKDKCLSSQWGGSADTAAVAYACVTHRSTLEHTKQKWIAVPVSSVKRDLSQAPTSHFNVKRFFGTKRSKKAVSSGTFYFITADHISNERTRALAGKKVVSAGHAFSTALQVFQPGSKAQQWRVTPH